LNVAGIEIAPQSLPTPSLAAVASSSSLSPSNPPSELGAFLALFNGFVASSATPEISGSLDLPLPQDPEAAQPRTGKDRNKGDKPKEKLPDSSAASLAQTGLDLSNVLITPPVVVLPAAGTVSSSLVDAVAAPAAPTTYETSPDNIAPAPLRSNPAFPEAPIAFALRLTDRTAKNTPQSPENSRVDAKPIPIPIPSADYGRKNIAVADIGTEAPAPQETTITDCPEPVADAKQLQIPPTIAQAPGKEFIAIQRPQVLSDTHAPPETEALPVRIPDPLLASQSPELPNVMPASPPVEAQKTPDAPSNASPARIAPDGAQSEQNSVEPTHSPAQERVVFPRSQQQHTTQQDTGNEQQPGSKDSKAPATDRRDASPQRNQSSTPNDPINFDTRVRTAPEPAVPGRIASDSAQTTKIAPDIEINPATSTQATRQISLKLEGPDSQKVAIQLTERAGKVQVAVRTGDGDLAKSLQGDLGELVGRLENKGFKTEAWVPAAVRHATAAVFEPGNPANSQGQSGNSGSGTGREPDQQRQNGSNQRQHPRWAAQLEESLDETGKEK
jgi:hypothetical protein